jgi:DNA-binding transcriptional ArsR family regulator
VASSKPEAARDERVFEAIADPTRRGILELLRRNDVLTAGEIAGEFPAISRPAVSRHLRVLRDAGLVAATESGREWHYQLNAEPLREMQERWLAGFAPMWDTSLRRLKRAVESDGAERRGSRRETPPPPRSRRKARVR